MPRNPPFPGGSGSLSAPTNSHIRFDQGKARITRARVKKPQPASPDPKQKQESSLISSLQNAGLVMETESLSLERETRSKADEQGRNE